MYRLTIAESFQVQIGGRPARTWYALEGEFESEQQLPPLGSLLLLQSPDGRTVAAQLAGRSLWEREASLRFNELEAQTFEPGSLVLWRRSPS